MEERVARGRAARTAAPRSSHGRWVPAATRPDPIALLEEQAETRVPSLVPIRHGRMLDCPFAFFRGVALMMASDLSSTARSASMSSCAATRTCRTSACSPAPERHSSSTSTTSTRRSPGPWDWDVKRLAASFEVLGASEGSTSRPPRNRRRMRRRVPMIMRRTAGMRTLEAVVRPRRDRARTWISSAPRSARSELVKDEAEQAKKDIAKARTRDRAPVARKRDGRDRRRAPHRRGAAADHAARRPLTGGRGARGAVDCMQRLVAEYRRSFASSNHPFEEFKWVDMRTKSSGWEASAPGRGSTLPRSRRRRPVPPGRRGAVLRSRAFRRQ